MVTMHMCTYSSCKLQVYNSHMHILYMRTSCSQCKCAHTINASCMFLMHMYKSAVCVHNEHVRYCTNLWYSKHCNWLEISRYRDFLKVYVMYVGDQCKV